MRISFGSIGKPASGTSSEESRFRWNAKLARQFVRWKASLPDKRCQKNLLSGERLIARTKCDCGYFCPEESRYLGNGRGCLFWEIGIIPDSI